ncbi:MAG: phenylalanine--tRNA ligase subunit alpha, partial [Deltaproteobacteria bacterium]|nr:phenylalanine--tRNA ligase subunit alpha [Deltaproteobacteria bacterium]
MPDLSDRIRGLSEAGLSSLSAAKTESDLLEVKGRFFGKKGELSEILKNIASLPIEERKRIGEAANEARNRLESAFDARLKEFRERERLAREGAERVDVTLPGRAPDVGHRHPIARTMAE